MKRSILWLLLTMFIAAYSIAYADTVQIGTGTSTTSYLPLNGLYGYSYTQQIYTQTQIGVSGNIEKIRFYYVSGTITNSKDWVIYMGHTTKTTFSSSTDWEPLANLTQVFSGDVSSLVPQANNWMEITLDTPFSYNNTDNLVIAVDENTSGYASMSWGAFSSGSNTGIYYYSDSTNPDPASPPTASNRTGSINRVQLVFPSTSAPLAPTLGSPTNEATGIALDALLTWSSTPGAGDATSYDVYMDTVNGSTLVSNDQAGTSYSPTLAYSTTYHWKVVASNAIGDSPASEVWTFTTIPDPTIVVGPESPWVEDFGTETADWPVLNWSQRSGLYPTPTGTSAQWFRTNWLNGEAGNNAAKINIYGTARYGWLITPPIAIPATGYELKFDLGLTDCYYSNAIEFPEGQADDRFIVAISSTPDMASPTILREWNNSGSEYVYNAISHLGETQIIDLSAYTGTYYVAFYGESTVSVTGEDNDLFVDNVTVRETPSLPIISVSPESWDFGTQLINTTTSQSFTIANDGGAPLSLNSVNVTGTGFALSEAFSSITLQPLENTTITVNFSPLTEATYSGNIVISDNRAPTNIPLTGAAIDATIYSGDLPHIENFDSVTIPDLPVGWTSIDNNADNDYWKTATGYANSGDKSASIYTDFNTANDDYLVTPPIELTGSQRLSFWTRARSTSEPEELSVVLSTTTPTSGAFTNVLMTSTPINFTTYTQYNIDLDDYNGICYIAFKRAADPANGYYLYIDDVKIDVILPEPPEPATLVWPLNGITTLPNPLLKWAPSATGEPVTTYKVYMNDSGTFTETDLIYEGTATQFQTADMGYERTYYWKVLPINAHGSDPTCPTWSFSTPLENQLAEGFENTVPPAGWSSVGTAWSRGSSYKVEGSYSAYKAGSTSSQYILSTPLLTIIEGSTLQFGALGTTTSASLEIVYSEDRTTWTQIGSTITFPVATTFYPQVIDLSDLAGNNYYLGFRTGLTSGSTYIDHVIGPEITPVLPGAPVLTAPANAAVNQSNYPSFTWTAPTTGGVPSGYNLYLDTVDGSTLYASNVTSPYVPTTALDWEVTYYWTVKALNNAGTGDAPAARSFTVRSDPTIYVDSTTPWLVDFGTSSSDTFPPTNWTRLSGLFQTDTPTTTSSGWLRDDWLNGASGNNAAKVNIYGTSCKYWLVTPPISIPATGYELKFDVALLDWNGTVPPVAGEQADDKFIVVMSDTPIMSNPTILREWNNDESPYVFDAISHTGSSITIPLAGVTGTKYFAFYAESSVSGGDNDLMVDNVIVRETPSAPIFSYAPTAIDFGTVMQNVAATAQNVTVTNTGGGTINLTTANISITGTDAAMFSYVATNLPAALAGGQSVTIPVTVTVTSEGAKTATLTINYNSENYDVALSATGLPAGIVVIGDGTANNNLPVYPYFGYTYSQSIFLQSEINVPDQRIESVYYYWNGVAEAVDSNNWTIYMGHTAATEFASTTDWIPLANLSTVFTGTVALPATAGWIEIPLTSPFVYNNTDNLVIAVDENAASCDGSSEFFYSTAAATNRSLRYYSDSTNPDPAAPVAGTLVLAYPNVMLQFGDLPTTPIFSITPSEEWDFGLHQINTVTQKEFTITNTGAGTLRITNLLVSGDPEFALSSAWGRAVNLTAGQSYIFTVDYSPTAAGTHNGLVSITDNLSRNVTEIALLGTGMDATIATFPWNENFDLATTLPTGWTVSDVDGGGTTWVGTTNYAHSAPNAFMHSWSTAVPDPGQNGWLITPAIQVPAGNYYLSWWNYNVFPTWMVYNGVKVNTTNNPADPNWVEIWSQGTAASAWSQAVVNISAYAGQTVYFAFNYQGYDGDGWYIDDVSVYELLVDTFGPTITHLPLINTPREDIGNYVVADIADDATWNNPIGGANMYYSIDGGTTWSAPVAMTLDVAPTYYALIPPQALGTTVTYYIEAWDNLNNMTSSDEFSYDIDDPTWVWYDEGGTTYLGYTTTDFGPTVMFNNPFYGTGNAMQLLAVDGSSYYGNTANLQIWTYDGVNDLVPYFATPIPVTFGAQTYETFDLSTYNVQISSPYFFVSYLDVPMDNYILFDSTYDYGTTYVFQGTTLYTMSNPGSWAIGANVTTGMNLALDTPVVTIELNASNEPVLSWDAITGANSYEVYGAADPYAADPWTLLGTVAMSPYTYEGTEAMQFFKVVANSEAPTMRGTATSLPTRSIGNAVRAPKVIINNIRN